MAAASLRDRMYALHQQFASQPFRVLEAVLNEFAPAGKGSSDVSKILLFFIFVFIAVTLGAPHLGSFPHVLLRPAKSRCREVSRPRNLHQLGRFSEVPKVT